MQLLACARNDEARASAGRDVVELTIIGVYAEREHARAAKHELIAAGFGARRIQLTPDTEAPPAGSAAAPGRDRGVEAVGNIFRSLLGSDFKNTYSNVYAEAVHRGDFVLTVEVDSDEQRVRAEEIMGRHGPVDLEERSEAWVREGWRGHDPGAGRPQQAAPAGIAGRLRAFMRRKDGQGSG
jgi:hypothetical protein